MKMRLPSLTNSRTKTIIHGVQSFIIFLGWALTIAVFTREGENDGRTVFYFALCWLTIPGLVYLTAVPMWPRLRRFGNPYAFAAVDGLYTILWFAALVAVATYVGSGKSEGESNQDDDDKEEDKKSGCDAFAYGSPAKCELSTGTVVLGVFVYIIFVGTTYLSVKNLMQYRRTGTMPYDGSDPTFAAHSQAAFSSNPAHDFDEEDDRDAEFRTGRMGDGHPSSSSLGGRRDDDEYALLQHSELEDAGPQGGRPPPSYDPTASNISSIPPSIQAPIPAGSTLHDYDTSYTGAYGHQTHPSGDYGYNR